jgi:uncharacterized protein YbaR (Trm112 family)
MSIQMVEPITKEQLYQFINQAAKAAEYKGFGMPGCDLAQPIWWSAYCRQSLDQQTQNNRLPDYLLTLAHMAKDQDVIVPLEYVFYDHKTGEHLERPGMLRLRKLMQERRISGIIFPALDRLSREPLHQQIFELEAEHYGVKLLYADVPNGVDPGSQFARTILAHAAKLVKIVNRRNNRGGNIGRVVSGNVPAGKTSYGYKYQAQYDTLSHGRRKLVKAEWVVDSLNSDGELEFGSEAWTVVQVFRWVGHEGRTLYWVAKKLNDLSVKPRYAKQWSPALISFIVRNYCYTGNHVYNKAAYMPNPNKPLGDITGAVKRTIRRPKAEEERVSFKIPVLIPTDLWELANNNLAGRGRGRGKQGKSIEALLRGRVCCPQCNRPLSVYRDSNHRHLMYYICSTRSQGWKKQRCHFPAFRIEWLDNVVWDCVYALVKQPALVEEELSAHDNNRRTDDLTKRIKLLRQKIDQTEAKIRRIHEGYEAEPPLYTATEAEERIRAFRDLITRIEKEQQRLQTLLEQQVVGRRTIELVRRTLEKVRDENLENASFSEKQELIAKLGIMVYPSADHKTVRIASRLPIVGDTVSPQIISMASPKL